MTAIPIAPFGQAVALPGFWDTFPGADGSAPGNGWIDLATGLAHHAPAKVQSGRVGIGAASFTGSGITKVGLGQFGIYRKVGLTDGVEVTLRHHRATNGLDPDLDDLAWQFGPSVFVDPTGAQAQMGMSLTWDISVTHNGGALVQMMGLFDQADWLNPTYYVIYEGAWMDIANIRVGDADGMNVMKLRCVGGKCAGYWNGVRCLGPFDVPSWALGRDGWGAHTIMASGPISNIGNIDTIRVQPWSQSLGSYPAVPAVGAAGSTVKAAAAGSVAVAYPTSPAAGALLVAVVATNNGNFNTPAGWQSDGTATVTSGIRATVFTKLADGTETGTMTFVRSSGTGDCAGFMFAVTGQNPLSPAHGAAGSVNTASTALASGSHSIFGPNRQSVWVGATATATAITMPAGYTSIANAGTAGASINVAAGYKPISSAGQSTTGVVTGTLGGSVASVGLLEVIDPDPR